MAVLPVCRSPRINSRWPRPIGMSASTTLRPVWSGTVTGARSMMAGGGAFDGQALAGGDRPVAIERPAERVDDASEQSVAHGHVHDPARALDFIARVQMPVVAEQHDADFVLVHVERDAEHAAGKRRAVPQSPRRAGRTPWRCRWRRVVIVPTSRGVSCGVKAPRTCAYASERAVEDALQAFRWQRSWSARLGSAFARPAQAGRLLAVRSAWLGFGFSLTALFQQFVDALFQRREVVRDAPRHFLSVRGELDPADQSPARSRSGGGCQPRRFR